MNPGRTGRLAGPVLLAALLSGGEGQPWLAYAYPAGGQRGSTVSVTLAGERLVGATAVMVSGDGVAARLVAAPTAPDEAGRKKKRNQTVMDEVGTIELAIAADAAPGARSLRLVTPTGLSNPRTFVVGELAEHHEAPAPPPGRPDAPAAARPPIAVPALPAVVNGQIQLGETDRWTFTAPAGLRLVCAVSARALVPYIADAVPGWCQPHLTLFGPDGRELALADLSGFRQDAIAACTLPLAGTYTLAVRDALWRGRPDFTYRIALGALPVITAAWPLGAQAGAGPVEVRLDGENLPVATLRVDPQPGLAALALGTATWPFAVTGPGWVDGRLEHPGATAQLSFSGRKGSRIAIEVQARRLGSPLDARIAVLAADGAVVASGDDTPDRGEGLLTHHADPELTCVLPEDGDYRVRLADALGGGGAAYGFRLRIGPPAPDVRLLAAPSSLAVPPGGSVPLTVHALRRGGCTAPIRLELDGCPGLVLDAAVIPAGADRVRTTISAAPGTAAGVLTPRIVGAADGLPRSCAGWTDEQMQAFLWTQLVPAAGGAVAVLPEAPPLRLMRSGGPVELKPGRAASIPLRIERRAEWDGDIRIQLSDPPPGVTLRNGRIKARAATGVLEVNLAADARIPAGNIIAFAQTARSDGVGADGKPRTVRATVWLPAIPIAAEAP